MKKSSTKSPHVSEACDNLFRSKVVPIATYNDVYVIVIRYLIVKKKFLAIRLNIFTEIWKHFKRKSRKKESFCVSSI
jgi:uncharacterized protein YozE (UPF0346 family)